MKSIHTSPRKLTFRPFFSGVIMTAILPMAASADPLFWNPGGTGGDGIWGTGPGERNWNTIAGADAGNVAWPEIDGPTAVFSDMVGGVVTVFDEVGIRGLRLDGADYQLFGGTLIPSDAASPIEIVVNGDYLSINSEIAGAAGITMQGPGTLVLQGSNAFTGPLSLNGGGTIVLEGSLSNTTITTNFGATFENLSGGLADTTALTNAGTLFMGVDDTIASYASNGGLLEGPGVLTVSGAAELNDGSSVVGSLIADSILSHGAVEVSGSVTAPMASVQTGTLTLNGLLDTADLGISSGATLENMSGGLADPTALTNAGTLFMGVDDTIARYISNGGRITGPGLLTIGEVVLNDGSVVGGRLAANQLTTHGRVQLDGQTRTGRVDVRSGALINRGSLHTGILNIASGAAFVPRGWQSYGLLTTSGPGTAYWLGHLRNRAGVAPGGIGGVGRLMVTGNFTNTPHGTLHIDLAGRGGDMLLVGGTARLGGTLELNQVGNITPFVSIPIITAGAYEGNFHTMRADTSRPVWFNPETGSVMALREANPRTNSGIWGANVNQTAVWVSLYDDVVDPGRTNITRDGSRGYRILGGLGDHKRPELLHALAASFTPTGLNPVVLDRLSPEAYAGLQDHAIHATRSMTRSATRTPAIHSLRQASGPESRVEVFAAFDTFRSPSGVESGPADYRPSGHGFLAGLRAHLRSGLVVGAWGGVHDGEVKGSLLDADASGMALGLFARARVHEPTATELEVGLGYGKYEYDGRRGGLRANAEGWRPTGIGFRNVDAEALHAHIDLSATIWQDDTLRIIPNVSLLSTWGKRDGFSEQSGSGGDAVGLVLDSDTYRASFVEGGLRTEVDLSDSIEAHILGGASLALDRSPHNLTARFASGDRPMHLSSEGINQDSLFIGLGTIWRPSRELAFGAHWRADFRRNGDTNHQLGLSGAITF